MQRAPVKVGHNAESLARLLGNPLFTSDYVIFTYGSRGQLRIRPISEFHRLVRRRSAANNCIYPPPHAEKQYAIWFLVQRQK